MNDIDVKNDEIVWSIQSREGVGRNGEASQTMITPWKGKIFISIGGVMIHAVDYVTNKIIKSPRDQRYYRVDFHEETTFATELEALTAYKAYLEDTLKLNIKAVAETNQRITEITHAK